MPDHPSVPPGSLLGGKFRIDRLLGAGAMGTVYAIDHELTHHKRALKLLHPAVQSIPDIVRRFLKEASAAGRAGNPHLVETFDAGTLPTGEPYVVMELLEGETLAAVLDRERALEPSLAAELVAQAAEGMEAAHRAGIVHRDLKPENLFVTVRDGRPFIKIMDFGVSKFATGTSSGMVGTRAGMVYGSPAYMSPEQLTAQVEVDARSDVFSLGVVLFQCLTGTLPFDAPTLEVLAIRVLSGELAPMETLRPGLQPRLTEVVRHALAPNRDDRIESARALAEALAPFRLHRLHEDRELPFAATIVSGAPALATSNPSSLAPSLPPGVPRRPTAIWLFALAVGLLAAAIGALLATRSMRSEMARSAPLPTMSAIPASPAPPLTAAVSSEEPSLSPLTETTVPSSGTRRSPAGQGLATVTTAATPSPSATAPATTTRPSAAQNLGLREDNPFR